MALRSSEHNSRCIASAMQVQVQANMGRTYALELVAALLEIRLGLHEALLERALLLLELVQRLVLAVALVLLALGLLRLQKQTHTQTQLQLYSAVHAIATPCNIRTMTTMKTTTTMTTSDDPTIEFEMSTQKPNR